MGQISCVQLHSVLQWALSIKYTLDLAAPLYLSLDLTSAKFPHTPKSRLPAGSLQGPGPREWFPGQPPYTGGPGDPFGALLGALGPP